MITKIPQARARKTWVTAQARRILNLRRRRWKKHSPHYWVKYNWENYLQMAAQSRTRTVIVISQVGNSFNPTSQSFNIFFRKTGQKELHVFCIICRTGIYHIWWRGNNWSYFCKKQGRYCAKIIFSITILYCDRKRVEQEHLLSVTRYLIQSTIHWKGKRKPSAVLNQLILSTSTDQTFPPTNQLISRMEMWRTTFGLRFPTLSTHDHLAWCKYIFVCRHFHWFQVYSYI